jgi:transposase-like protein
MTRAKKYPVDPARPSAFDPIPAKEVPLPPKPPVSRKKPINLADVENYASYGMTVDQVCQCLGIGIDTYYDRMKELPEFKAAIDRGRAKRSHTMAKIIIDIAENTMAEDRDRLKAAELYLRRHGGGDWKDQSKLDVNHSGSIDLKTTMDDATLLRAAQTYADQKGGE